MTYGAHHNTSIRLGILRWVGSNLARLELPVGLQEWLRAFRHYELDESKPMTWANGPVRGPRKILVLLNG